MKRNRSGKPSEHGEQCAVIDWCNASLAKYPMLKWIYAIPNGVYLGRDRRGAAIRMGMLKAEGLNTSVPDLCLPYPLIAGSYKDHPGGPTREWKHTFLYAGLYIEMKIKGGTVDPDQKEWIEYLKSVGYRAEVAWSADEAIDIIKDYLEG